MAPGNPPGTISCSALKGDSCSWRPPKKSSTAAERLRPRRRPDFVYPSAFPVGLFMNPAAHYTFMNLINIRHAISQPCLKPPDAVRGNATRCVLLFA